MIKGSCLCGTFRYEIRGELRPIVLCHCAQCRKAQGGAFAANAAVRYDAFAIIAGGDALAASKAEWEDTCDDLPQYAGLEPALRDHKG